MAEGDSTRSDGITSKEPMFEAPVVNGDFVEGMEEVYTKPALPLTAADERFISYHSPSTNPPTTGWGLAALILGICSFVGSVICPWLSTLRPPKFEDELATIGAVLGWSGGIAAIVTSAVCFGRERNRRNAQWGRWLTFVGPAFWVLYGFVNGFTIGRDQLLVLVVAVFIVLPVTLIILGIIDSFFD